MRYTFFVPADEPGSVPGASPRAPGETGAPAEGSLLDGILVARETEARALLPRGDHPAPLAFRRGAHAPFAVRWYGITSLFGHLRHFVASAIASEQVDSRDWMRAEEPTKLVSRMLGVLGEANGAAPPGASTLTEGLGRAVWIDWVADTGDDRDVSAAVGKMLFGTYEVESHGVQRLLPRGDVLLMGGDTAYPVATADEIHARVIEPWNETLRAAQRTDGRRRVLLGIPGNHDWYDGLDGFARMFRRAAEPHKVEEPDPPSRKKKRLRSRLRSKEGRKTGFFARQLHLDEIGGLLRLLFDVGKFIGAFYKGGGLRRRKRLVLAGYEPVQDCSYWQLPVAPGLDFWGVDRQLDRIDFRQRAFFKRARRPGPDHRIVFIAPDPAIAFGERHDPGARMLASCKLALDKDRFFYLCGDMHQYERRVLPNGSLHVIAGGGGAFLHGTRISPSPSGPAARAWPDAQMTRRLNAQVPLRLMLGSGGFLVHLLLLFVASLELGAELQGPKTLAITAFVLTLGITWILFMIAGLHRAHPERVFLLALPFGAALGLGPMLLRSMLPRVVPTLAGDGAVMVAYAFLGAFGFGLFLATLCKVGIEHQQAFTVLAHPGFKHFVRLCVEPDGRIEAWAIGKDDALAPGDPVLVDRFTWE
jgi:hypothetical protein